MHAKLIGTSTKQFRKSRSMYPTSLRKNYLIVQTYVHTYICKLSTSSYEFAADSHLKENSHVSGIATLP